MRSTRTGRPVIAGRSAWAVATSGNGTRVHLGGEFSYLNGENGTALIGTVDDVTGANIPGWQSGPHVAPRGSWPLGGIVYDLGVYDNNLFVTGAEHYWEQRNATTGAAIRVNAITNDSQRVEVIGDRVYIGCHCDKRAPAAEIIEVDAAKGKKLRDLGGSLISGDGAWAFTKAPDGCLWAGGDFRSTDYLVGRSGTNWVGRMARMCDSRGPQPHNVPSLTRPPEPPDPNVLIAHGAEWRYLADGTHPAGWAQPSFADGGWPVGAGELGFGDGDETTVIPRQGLSALFRRTFEADPAAAPYLELGLNVDDGATVWVNGNPVVAENMPTGTIARDHAGLLAGVRRRRVGPQHLPAALERPGQRHQHDRGERAPVGLLQRGPDLRPLADPDHHRRPRRRHRRPSPCPRLRRRLRSTRPTSSPRDRPGATWTTAPTRARRGGPGPSPTAPGPRARPSSASAWATR